MASMSYLPRNLASGSVSGEEDSDMEKDHDHKLHLAAAPSLKSYSDRSSLV